MSDKCYGEYILVDSDGDYWQGSGYYTNNPYKAKTYPTYTSADAAVYRMKRRNFKITTIEDIEGERC